MCMSHLDPEFPAKIAAGGNNKRLSQCFSAWDEQARGTLPAQYLTRTILSHLFFYKFFKRLGAGHQHLKTGKGTEAKSGFVT